MNIQKPYRQARTARLRLAAPADDVFALMCPVREYEWEPGWTTNLILSETGLVEEGCIFTTPAGASAGSDDMSTEAIWVTPVHDRKNRRLTMIKMTPAECVTRLDIAIDETPNGSAAVVTYEHTALTEAGRRVVDQHTEERYAEMMAGWKQAIENQLLH